MSRECDACEGLCLTRTQVVLPSSPSGTGGLCVIGEAPGADEDREGEGFVGRAGKTLDHELAIVGITSYAKANIVRCRPPENRKPRKEEVENCIPRLVSFLELQKPDVVLLVGLSAASVFLSWNEKKKVSLSDLISRGNSTDLRPIVELAHPALRGWASSKQTPCVAMPHTSPLAWNRHTRDGVKWSEVGKFQVELAAGILRRKGG